MTTEESQHDLVRRALDLEADLLEDLGEHEEAAKVRARVPIDANPDAIPLISGAFDDRNYGDMQWRKADGTTGRYSGPLRPLGYGIPRKMRDWGFRRAAYDFCFGYVSGFPLRDILAYSLHSLFPQKTLYAEVEWLDEQSDDPA